MITHEELVDRRRQALRDLRDEYERKPASQYRAAVLAAVDAADDVITDAEEALRSSEETWQRAYDRQQRDLERAQSLTALSELRAVPADDETKVRVTLEPPATGLRVGHLQAAYVELTGAGAHDWSPLDTVETRDSYGHRWSAVVENPAVVNLRLPALEAQDARPAVFDLQDTTVDRHDPHWLTRPQMMYGGIVLVAAVIVAVIAIVIGVLF